MFPYTEEFAKWLRDQGYPCPLAHPSNRMPTPAEILAVLREVPDTKIEIDHHPYVSLKPRDSHAYWLVLETPPECSWNDETWNSHEFFTIKGDREKELSLAIALTATCGQLLIYPDSGAVPIIVSNADDPVTVREFLAQADTASDPWLAFHQLRYGREAYHV